jgi:hypothetical protein
MNKISDHVMVGCAILLMLPFLPLILLAYITGRIYHAIIKFYHSIIN